MALGWRKDYLRYKSFFLNIVNVYKQKGDIRMFLEILLSLATISFFGAFALRPTLLTITQLVKDIKEKAEIISQMDQKINNLEKAQTILEQKSGAISILESAVPLSSEPETLARQIENLVVKNAVKISGMSINETVLKGKAATPKAPQEKVPLPQNSLAMSFSLSTTGTYQNLSALVAELENLRIPLKLDIVRLNLINGVGGKNINLIVSGRMPYLGNQNEEN